MRTAAGDTPDVKHARLRLAQLAKLDPDLAARDCRESAPAAIGDPSTACRPRRRGSSMTPSSRNHIAGHCGLVGSAIVHFGISLQIGAVSVQV